MFAGLRAKRVESEGSAVSGWPGFSKLEVSDKVKTDAARVAGKI